MSVSSGNGDLVALQNISGDPEIGSGVGVIDRRRSHDAAFGFQRDLHADGVAVVLYGDAVVGPIHAQRHTGLFCNGKRKLKTADDTAVLHNGVLCTVEVYIRTEDADLTGYRHIKPGRLTGFHNTLCIDIDVGCPVIHLDVFRRLCHTIQPVPPFLHADTTHFKGNDDIPLFQKRPVQLAAVHGGIGRRADRRTRRIQSGDF